MKKFIPLIIIPFIICPAVCFSSYLIELNNGAEFIIHHYWEKDNLIKFYYYGGVVGIPKNFVKAIRKSDIAYKEKTDSKKKRIDLESEINEKPKMTGTEKKEKYETVDLEYYKEKKSLLAAELNRTLDKLREATKNEDRKAKKKARDEVKKISAKMYELTAELIKKNNGKMPEGWWEKK